MAAEGPAARLDPRLTVFDTAMVVVSLVVGIGIFRTPALVAGATRGAGPFLAAWAVGGAVSLIGALVFAEIGSRYPRAGGFYKVVAYCWHPLPAFLLNWAQVLMQGAGAAGVALIGSEYLLRVLGRGAPRAGETAWLGALMIGGLVTLNALGVRAGARTQNFLSLAKITLIAGLALAGLAAAQGSEAAVSAPAPVATSAGWLAALVAVFYAYGGYQYTMNLAGDVREARHRLPRAVITGMLVVAALYLSINVAYVRALGMDGVAASPLVAADLARRAVGGAGEAFVSLAIFLSAAGFVNATILHVPRTYLAMAEDRLLPPALGRLDPRTQAQGPGLAFFGLTALLPLLFLGSFERLLAYVMFTDALSLAVVASCLFILRRRGEADRTGAVWRMPAYPWLPALFVLAVLAVAAHVLIRQTPLALAGCAVVAAGVPLYFVLRRTLA
ncbi:MAG: amino acid permease [Acidobacteria bacterium]|nr:amino acid permease [Acidobacteriota bacterium]